MNKEEYRKYLRSREWLLKKNEFINIFISQGWEIRCSACGSTDNLQVHHNDYKEVGRENLSEKNSKAGRGVWQLDFLCGDCHTKTHFDKKWAEELEIKKSKEFSEIIKEMLLTC